jgi:hypothetical protein
MSSLNADPPFRRGRTLMDGNPVTLDGNSNPIEGVQIVGEVKAFDDVNPTSGVRNSNRVCYCVAARNTSGSAITPKTVVKFKASALLSEVDGSGDNTAGLILGVADEYLPTAGVPNNDIFWVVVQGPTVAKFTTAAIASAGAAVGSSATAGSLAAGSGMGHVLAAKALNATEARVVLSGTNIA